MRLKKPRVAPLAEVEWDEEAKEVLGPMSSLGPLLNIFATLGRHPKLLKRWLVFGNHVLAKSTLPPRERELVILRVGWLCRAEYEWMTPSSATRRGPISPRSTTRSRSSI
jgi:4-carboxymuconolactone decarboxylase